MLLLLALLPAPVLGDDGGIRVVSHLEESNFPSAVTFSLTAQGDNEIRSVRLNLRTAGSQTWTYAYPQFSLGKRITASFSLPTAGASYLPPGTEIEYQYSIEDALGNRHQTAPAVYEYNDNRFQWQETQVGPLTLRYYNLSRSRLDQAISGLEADLERIGDLLQSQPLRPIKGIIYNSRVDAEDALPRYSRTITEQQVFHGFAFPAHRVFIAIGFESGIIVHESSHLLLDQALDPRSVRIPSWLDEGLASYLEPGSRPFSGQSLSSHGPPLRAMSSLSGSPQDINTFYLKSESVVAYLVEEEGGADYFRDFLEELRSGQTIDAALLNTYGFDTDGLEERWSESSRGARSPSPDRRGLASPYFFVLFNSWLLGGLVLAVVAVVMVRFVVRKLRPATEDEEQGLQPWEDPDLQ
jgi:hypothetical protein